MAKKVNNKVTGTERHRFWLIYMKTLKKITFSSILTFFLQFSQKFFVHQLNPGTIQYHIILFDSFGFRVP